MLWIFQVIFLFYLIGRFRIKCLKDFFSPWWFSFICPISLKIETIWTMSGRTINPARIQDRIKTVILLGVLDIRLKIYFWQDLRQNRLFNALRKAWMVDGGWLQNVWMLALDHAESHLHCSIYPDHCTPCSWRRCRWRRSSHWTQL